MYELKSLFKRLQEKNIPIESPKQEIYDFYSAIKLWQEFYKGQVSNFHSYIAKKPDGTTCQSERITLGMAKIIAEEWASLLNFPDILIDNEEINDFVQNILKENNFKNRFNNFIEKTFALGNGIILISNNEDMSIKIEEKFIGNSLPLKFENNILKEILLWSESYKLDNETFKKEFLIIKNIDNETYFQNFYTISKSETDFTNCDIFFDENDIQIIENIKCFHFFKPNLTNNLYINNPLGISIFANAIDNLKMLDIIYDSLENDFIKGRMKAIYDERILKKRIINNNGENEYISYFDQMSDEFVATINNPDEDIISQDKKPLLNDLMKEIDFPIRTQEHIESIQFNLNLLSQKCGLGSGYYDFKNSKAVTKTATEVISEKSELFRNMKKHEFLIKQNLEQIINDIIQYGILNQQISNKKYNIIIKFDDSIANDDNTIREEMRKDVTLGIISKRYYLQKQYNLTEKESIKMLKDIVQDNMIENSYNEDEIKIENNFEVEED